MNQVQMAVGNGIERTGIDGDNVLQAASEATGELHDFMLARGRRQSGNRGGTALNQRAAVENRANSRARWDAMRGGGLEVALPDLSYVRRELTLAPRS